jgi:hypothetical protein
MSRFAKVGAEGATLPEGAAKWVAVIDNTTGLLWSAGNVGTGELTWANAKSACAALHLCGNSDWRLPTIEELFCLADRSRSGPAIDVAFFASTQSDFYWSGTPFASALSDYAWGVGFGNGYSGYNAQYDAAFVRAVRSASQQ